MTWLEGIGSALFAGWNAYSAHEQNEIAKYYAEENLKIAKKNQEMASDQLYRGHQIAVKDLREAGLNPILAANNAASASMVPQTSAPNLQNEGEAFGRGMASATALAQLGVMKSQIEANNAKASADNANARLSDSQTHINNGLRLEEIQSGIERNRSEMELNQSRAQDLLSQIEKRGSDIKLNSQLIKNYERQFELIGQEIITQYRQQTLLSAQAKESGARAVSYTADASRSYAQAGQAIQMAGLIMKQKEGQALTNRERAVIANFADVHPTTYNLIKNMSSVGSIAAAIAGYATDFFNTVKNKFK